jgi:hypothetical protein
MGRAIGRTNHGTEHSGSTDVPNSTNVLLEDRELVELCAKVLLRHHQAAKAGPAIEEREASDLGQKAPRGEADLGKFEKIFRQISAKSLDVEQVLAATPDQIDAQGHVRPAFPVVEGQGPAVKNESFPVEEDPRPVLDFIDNSREDRALSYWPSLEMENRIKAVRKLAFWLFPLAVLASFCWMAPVRSDPSVGKQEFRVPVGMH